MVASLDQMYVSNANTLTRVCVCICINLFLNFLFHVHVLLMRIPPRITLVQFLLSHAGTSHGGFGGLGGHRASPGGREGRHLGAWSRQYPIVSHVSSDSAAM